MKRFFALLVIIFASCTVAMAQGRDKHNYEIGASGNIYGILGMMGGPARELGPGVHFEYRYDITKRIDIGGRLYYKYGTGTSAFTGEPTYGIVYNQAGAKAVADFNMRPNKLLRPFVGVGAGLGMIAEKRATGDKESSVYGTISPRIGLQIWRFRVALDFDFAYNGQYGFLGTETASSLNVGFTF